MTVEVPRLGQIVPDNRFPDWLVSDPTPVLCLAADRSFTFVGYQDDENKEEFHLVLAAFLDLPPETFRQCEVDIHRYYRDVYDQFGDEPDMPVIPVASGVWAHIEIGSPLLERNSQEDGKVYVDIECNCGWDREHGLQISLREGVHVTKVGAFDGHLTNSNAYGRKEFYDITYVPIGS